MKLIPDHPISYERYKTANPEGNKRKNEYYLLDYCAASRLCSAFDFFFLILTSHSKIDNDINSEINIDIDISAVADHI